MFVYAVDKSANTVIMALLFVKYFFQDLFGIGVILYKIVRQLSLHIKGPGDGSAVPFTN